MTAQIIPFPRRNPLELHELPPEWLDSVRTHYLYLTYDGKTSHEEAFAVCQRDHDERQREGESYDDYVLRRARAAFARMRRRAT